MSKRKSATETVVVMTDAKRRQLVARMFKLAERYGVEDIEPREMIYAVEAFEARGETPEQVAKFLWGA